MGECEVSEAEGMEGRRVLMPVCYFNGRKMKQDCRMKGNTGLYKDLWNRIEFKV